MSAHAEEGFRKEWVDWFFGLLFDVRKQSKYVGDWGISRALYLFCIFFGLMFILGHLVPNLSVFIFQWMLGLAPVWLPITLAISGWHAWVWYIQSLYISGRNPVLLEMKVPREIFQSPRAMEIALSSLWISSGETTFLQRGWKGQVRPYFSLEIASFGGDVRFYIWCWKNYVHTVEETMYAMYPEIELHQVEDYASKFKFDPQIHNVFATDWRLESARDDDRGTYGKGKFRITDFYPIKTYIDFELDKDPKEEYRVDPLSSVIEFLSAAHEYEQIWIQLIIRRCGKYGVLNVQERDDEWKHGVLEEVEYLRAESNKQPGMSLSYEDFLNPPETDVRVQRFPNVTPRHRHMMEALDRNMSKLPFEFLGRGIYLSTRPLHGPTFMHMRWLWKSMGNSAYGTHLRPRRWHNDFDYPWQDIGDMRWNNQGRRAIDAFRRRSAFHSPWKMPTDVITNESLATIWRPPSSHSKSPGLERIPAKKAEAPLNLPR